MPGISAHKIGMPFAKKGLSWSSYWTTHLFGEDDLIIRTSGRSGLILPDTINSGVGDVKILTPTYYGHTTVGTYLQSEGGSTERVFDGGSYTIYCKLFFSDSLVDGVIFGTGGSTDRRGFAIDIYADGHGYVIYSDGAAEVYNAYTFPKNAWFEIHVQVDRANNQCRTYARLISDGSTIGTDRVNNISAWNFSATDNYASLRFTGRGCAFADFKKFSAVKALSQCQDNSYANDLQFYYPVIFDGTDVSGNNHHLTNYGTATANHRMYSQVSDYMLKNGFCVHRAKNKVDIPVSFSLIGEKIKRTEANDLVFDGSFTYVDGESVVGSVDNHNLADSILEFSGDEWDRSNTTIFNDDCRDSAWYDEDNPKRFHVSELNKFILNSYTNSGYQGIHFVKISNNSYEDRRSLLELFSYNNNKTGIDLTKVLLYCGDSGMVDILWLPDPYSDVVKITTTADSVFKFNINNAFIYSESEIYDQIDVAIKRNVNENKLTTIFNWCKENIRFGANFSEVNQVESNLINTINSRARGECAGMAFRMFEILDHYYPGEAYVVSLDGHTTNCADTDKYMDIGWQILPYKGYYEHATAADLIADPKLITEPIRKTPARLSGDDWYSRPEEYNRIVEGYQGKAKGYPKLQFTEDEIIFKLPSECEFIFPVIGTNVAKTYQGNDIVGSHGVCTVATGVTGVVQAPFMLLQVTGTGSVDLDGVTYSLPADEAALNAVIQGWEEYYNNFTIITNTGGITAEYLINNIRNLLWEYNRVDLDVVSGNVSYDLATTASPIPTIEAMIENVDRREWSINYTENKVISGKFKIPAWSTVDFRMYDGANVSPDPDGTLITSSSIINRVPDLVPVTDKCYAARLDPRDDDFTTTLELSFTIFDGSTCYYTLDGTTPDATKTAYSTPFTISASTTIKWVNIREGYADSHVNKRVITKI